MVQVIVRRSTTYFGNPDISFLVQSLPGIIADALTIPKHKEGELPLHDIKIYVTDKSPFDQNTLDLEITIFAHDYPELKENLEQRKKKIVNDLKKHEKFSHFKFREDQVFVLIILSTQSFTTF